MLDASIENSADSDVFGDLLVKDTYEFIRKCQIGTSITTLC